MSYVTWGRYDFPKEVVGNAADFGQLVGEEASPKPVGATYWHGRRGDTTSKITWTIVVPVSGDETSSKISVVDIDDLEVSPKVHARDERHQWVADAIEAIGGLDRDAIGFDQQTRLAEELRRRLS